MIGKVWWLWLIVLAGEAGEAGGETLSTFHSEVAVCRYSAAQSEVCWNACVNCHASTDPILPLDIYVNGDRQICANCHPEESMQGTGNRLLNYPGSSGGNHPSGIDYIPDASKRTNLVPEPVGPKLFTDQWGANPKVHCSTCHDSHANTVNLLRLSNQGSALCLSCHNK